MYILFRVQFLNCTCIYAYDKCYFWIQLRSYSQYDIEKYKTKRIINNALSEVKDKFLKDPKL